VLGCVKPGRTHLFVGGGLRRRQGGQQPQGVRVQPAAQHRQRQGARERAEGKWVCGWVGETGVKRNPAGVQVGYRRAERAGEI
jgi:hypothetical protein